MSQSDDIRAVVPDDLPAMAVLAKDTAMFSEDELGFMADMVEAWTSGAAGPPAHRWFAMDRGGAIGAGYLAADPMADGVVNLLFLGVLSSYRGQGVGAALIAHAETLARADGARLMLIETSSGAQFAPARGLYEHLGYQRDGQIIGFYGPDQDKVIWRKTL